MKSKKTRGLKKGELRVIQVEQEAVYELLREVIIERANEIFDILDITKIGFRWEWDEKTNKVICIIHNGDYYPDLDFDTLRKKVGITTSTFYTNAQQYQTIYVSQEEAMQWRKLPD